MSNSDFDWLLCWCYLLETDVKLRLFDSLIALFVGTICEELMSNWDSLVLWLLSLLVLPAKNWCQIETHWFLDCPLCQCYPLETDVRLRLFSFLIAFFLSWCYTLESDVRLRRDSLIALPVGVVDNSACRASMDALSCFSSELAASYAAMIPLSLCY